MTRDLMTMLMLWLSTDSIVHPEPSDIHEPILCSISSCDIFVDLGMSLVLVIVFILQLKNTVLPSPIFFSKS